VDFTFLYWFIAMLRINPVVTVIFNSVVYWYCKVLLVFLFCWRHL